MPYTNIHWIKLEKRLLNDHRFYSMSEESQLIYVKLLMLAAETKNKIPKNTSILKAALRSQQEVSKISQCMKEIKENFPKFHETKDLYKFNGWGVRHNWVAKKESLGISRGIPKEPLDKNRIDKNRTEQITREQITKVSEFYVLKKRFVRNELFNDDWTRIQKASKDLLCKAVKPEVAIEAIAWVSDQLGEKGYNWTLETVVKKYPDFSINRKSDKLSQLEKEVMGEKA